MLTLQIKRKWFDMIKSGEKKEEYREIKPYYETRFKTVFGIMVMLERSFPTPKEIRFRNGYRKDSPEFTAKCTIRKGTGKPEWGAEPHKQYYILDILEIK